MHAFVLPLSTKAGDDLHAVIRAVHEVPTYPHPSSHLSKAATLILLTSTKQSSPRGKNIRFQNRSPVDLPMPVKFY